MEPYVSVVITGRNASLTIEECLQSVLSAHYPMRRYEVIYVDAQSTDDTSKRIEMLTEKHQNFRHVVEPGLPGRGRNRGIKESKGEIIAFTDADCRVHQSWIRNIAFHLDAQDDDIAGVGGPSLTHDSDAKFPQFVGRLFETGFGSLGVRNPAIYRGLRLVDHNPTCNSAYRRQIFEEVGLFNDSLPVTEDVEFDTRVRRNGYRLLYADDVIVWHHRKSTVRSFAKQMYSYGFWRAHSGKMRKVPLKLVHFAPSLLIVYLLVFLLASTSGYILLTIPLIAYLTFGLASGIYMSLKSRDPLLTFIVLSLGFVEHTAYGAGFISGLVRSAKPI